MTKDDADVVHRNSGINVILTSQLTGCRCVITDGALIHTACQQSDITQGNPSEKREISSSQKLQEIQNAHPDDLKYTRNQRTITPTNSPTKASATPRVRITYNDSNDNTTAQRRTTIIGLHDNDPTSNWRFWRQDISFDQTNQWQAATAIDLGPWDINLAIQEALKRYPHELTIEDYETIIANEQLTLNIISHIPHTNKHEEDFALNMDMYIMNKEAALGKNNIQGLVTGIKHYLSAHPNQESIVKQYLQHQIKILAMKCGFNETQANQYLQNIYLSLGWNRDGSVPMDMEDGPPTTASPSWITTQKNPYGHGGRSATTCPNGA